MAMHIIGLLIAGDSSVGRAFDCSYFSNRMVPGSIPGRRIFSQARSASGPPGSFRTARMFDSSLPDFCWPHAFGRASPGKYAVRKQRRVVGT